VGVVDNLFLPLSVLVHPGAKAAYVLFGGIEFAAFYSLLHKELKNAHAVFVVYPSDISDTARRAILLQHWLISQASSLCCAGEQKVRFAMQLARACGVDPKRYTQAQYAELFGVSERTVKRAAKLERAATHPSKETSEASPND